MGKTTRLVCRKGERSSKINCLKSKKKTVYKIVWRENNETGLEGSGWVGGGDTEVWKRKREEQ